MAYDTEPGTFIACIAQTSLPNGRNATGIVVDAQRNLFRIRRARAGSAQQRRRGYGQQWLVYFKLYQEKIR